MEIRGFDLDKLNTLAERVATSISGVPGITDVETQSMAGMPQEKIHVDRDKIADLGLSVRDVTQAP